MSERWLKLRIWMVGFALMGLLSVQGAWLVYLQLGDQAFASRDWDRTITAPRGMIYDSGGYALARSVPGKRVFLDPGMAEPTADLRAAAAILGEVLDLETDYVLISMNRNDSRYIPLGVCLDDEAIGRLAGLEQAGVFLEDVLVRKYPLGETMAPVLGFVNAEGVGSAGIEHQFDKYLQGSPGYIESKLDARRREIYKHRNRYVPPISGEEISLTLDRNIQHVVETALDNVIGEFNAEAAWAVVQRVTTGEILALASRPGFDPNHYNESRPQLWRNRAIHTVYEPGSTMKALVVAAALNENLITPESLFDVGHGVWMYAGRPLRDHVKGEVDVRTILKKSSNIGAAQIGLKLGNARLENYLRAFGVGECSGIDLPGEETGILAAARTWSKISPTRISIGQGVAVTAVQMLNVYCTLANGGVRMRPYLVRRVGSAGGEVLFQGQPQVLGNPVRAEVADEVRRMLMEVTREGGTGTRASMPGYSVAGKTGTAQIPVDGAYSETEFWSSFVGVFPGERPEIGIIVVVERPGPQRGGGYVAAPVFKEIGQSVAQYLAVAPSPVPGREEQVVDRYTLVSGPGGAP